MKEAENTRTKRSQRDYSMGFKLGVISQVEKGELTYKQAQKRYGIQGRSTVLSWLRKYGELNWNSPKIHSYISKMKETPAHIIKRLERELKDEKLKNLILNKAIEISDTQYGTSIRKKLSPKLSDSSEKQSE